MPHLKHSAIWGALGLIVFLSLLTAVAVMAAPGGISTVAGNGNLGFSGDGGAANVAELNFPNGVAIDSSGNVFFADRNNHRIRKVDTAGNISTVAGNGTLGYAGDGGPATAARLNFPSGIAVDSSGNLFIADRDNHRVRKVDTSGIITTTAGNGLLGFTGDGIPATDARFHFPTEVAVDSSGNLFIVDINSHRIRKVGSAGIITTVAGNGRPGVLRRRWAGHQCPIEFPLRRCG